MTTFSVAIIAQNENNPVFKACLDSALNYFQADLTMWIPYTPWTFNCNIFFLSSIKLYMLKRVII